MRMRPKWFCGRLAIAIEGLISSFRPLTWFLLSEHIYESFSTGNVQSTRDTERERPNELVLVCVYWSYAYIDAKRFEPNSNWFSYFLLFRSLCIPVESTRVGHNRIGNFTHFHNDDEVSSWVCACARVCDVKWMENRKRIEAETFRCFNFPFLFFPKRRKVEVAHCGESILAFPRIVDIYRFIALYGFMLIGLPAAYLAFICLLFHRLA